MDELTRIELKALQSKLKEYMLKELLFCGRMNMSLTDLANYSIVAKRLQYIIEKDKEEKSKGIGNGKNTIKSINRIRILSDETTRSKLE